MDSEYRPEYDTKHFRYDQPKPYESIRIYNHRTQQCADQLGSELKEHRIHEHDKEYNMAFKTKMSFKNFLLCMEEQQTIYQREKIRQRNNLGRKKKLDLLEDEFTEQFEVEDE